MDEPTVALSSRQYGLWFQERLLTTAAGSASVIGELLVGPLDVQALRKAFGAVVRCHDSLRYRFPDRRGPPPAAVGGPGGGGPPGGRRGGDAGGPRAGGRPPRARPPLRVGARP